IGDNETPFTNPVGGGIVALIPGGGGEVNAVAAGGNETCAIVQKTHVACWGDGFYGQLGYGNTNDIGDNQSPAYNPAGDGFVKLPTTDPSALVSIAVGDRHACVMKASGNVACWGYGDNGALGYANHYNIGDDETPSQILVNNGFVKLPGLAAA